MNTLEQTNDIVNEIELACNQNGGWISLLLYDGKKLENIQYKKLLVNEEDPENPTAFLEYTTEATNESSIVNLFEVKKVA